MIYAEACDVVRSEAPRVVRAGHRQFSQGGFPLWNFAVHARFSQMDHYWTVIGLGGYADTQSRL